MRDELFTSGPFQTSQLASIITDSAKSDDRKLLVKRVLKTILIAAAIVMAIGSGALADPDLGRADEGQHPASVPAPPMLVKPPFPSGYKPPVNLHMPKSSLTYIPNPADLDNLQTPCLAYDLGIDGRATNIVVFRPSGITVVDQFAVASVADSRYQPAAVDGQPIVQRIISERRYNFDQHHSSGPPCSWEMYDAYVAQHSPAVNHVPPASVP